RKGGNFSSGSGSAGGLCFAGRSACRAAKARATKNTKDCNNPDAKKESGHTALTIRRTKARRVDSTQSHSTLASQSKIISTDNSRKFCCKFGARPFAHLGSGGSAF